MLHHKTTLPGRSSMSDTQHPWLCAETNPLVGALTRNPEVYGEDFSGDPFYHSTYFYRLSQGLGLKGHSMEENAKLKFFFSSEWILPSRRRQDLRRGKWVIGAHPSWVLCLWQATNQAHYNPFHVIVLLTS